MNNKLKILFTAFSLISIQALAQFTANAGANANLCPGGSVVLGGFPAATGGLPPYTYSWSPNWYLSSTTSPNPTSTSPSWVEYTLTVTDDTGAVVTDKVIVDMSYQNQTDAGRDTSICENSTAILGNILNINSPGITYSWAPAATLNNPNAPRPIASPGLTSTTYTVTINATGCPPKIDQVTVSVIPTPPVNAGNDTTIMEGENVTLNGSGATYYYWAPINSLTYPNTAHPDAEPVVTTTYTVTGTDPTYKCYNSDTVRITVIKSDEIVIYNTITPNGDGNNDIWYMGNIQKYPNNVLELYNRYGKLVYRVSPYLNDFEGTVSGQELPAATYFYELNLGDGFGKKHGTLTIVR